MNYNFYEFPKEEFNRRLNILRRSLSEENIDIAILTGEENIRWISGYWVFTMSDHSIPTLIIIPSSENLEPILILSSDATGENLSWIKKIRYWDEKSKNSITINKGKVLLDIINELNFKSPRIGMEMGTGTIVNLELKDIDYFRTNLTDVEFTDISNILWKVRCIKSNIEIEKLKKASKITTDSFLKGFKILKEGITERELGQYFVQYWFNNGATGIGHVGITFTNDAIKYAHCDPKEYPLKKDMLAKVDLGCTFEGYRSDMYRMACIGRPNEKEVKIAKTIKKAVNVMIKTIREGLKCSDLFNIVRGVYDNEGLGHLITDTAYIGHGIGLSIHELPYIHKNSNDILKSGMVFAIEPWTFDKNYPPACMNIEDVVLVKRDGCEVLTDMERDIFLL